MNEFKPVEQWNESYLDKVLDAASRLEQNWIEYKSSGVVNNELNLRQHLGKALSAFGNRNEGGYLLIGVKGGTADKLAEIDGGVSMRHKKHGTKEWLGQVIPGLTDKHSPDCKIGQIKRSRDKSKVKKGNAVFVVEIPANAEMPIRSDVDKIYYYRKDAHSEPLDHQQVLDIIHRRTTPRFVITDVDCDPRDGHANRPNEHPITISLKATNASNRVAIHAAMVVFLPSWLNLDRELSGTLRWQPRGKEGPDKCYSVWAQDLRGVIFPRQPFHLHILNLVFTIGLLIPSVTREYAQIPLCLLDSPEIGLVLYADDAPPSAWKLHMARSAVVKPVLAAILREHHAIPPTESDLERGEVHDVEDAIREHLGIPVEVSDLSALAPEGTS